MNEIVHIGNADISIKEYKGQRVVTFKDIDAVHERPDGTARKRFSDNRNHFIEGEDYFIVTPQTLENTELSEKRTLENSVTSNRGTALITEQGYLMLVKSFTDDLAWEVQRKLVSSYFNVHQIVNEQLSPELQMLQGLLGQMVQKNADKQFSSLRTEMYTELEERAGCDLSTRLRNKRNRMQESGCTKTEINNLNKMDIIEEDKKLREIFSKIVSEYEIQYCV